MSTAGIALCKWDIDTNGPMTEDRIRALHVPQAWHRVSKRQFPAGARFPTSTRDGFAYVLQGRCRYTRNGASVELAAGEFGRISEGTYQFEVLGDDELIIVKAWKLPFEVPPQA